ncbi:MAG: hypothetical protein COA32_15020 [Fluviicola sp.]|nr:MAG: hypothetical protein COA32_15020 [Fluviicola sp.]
MKSIPIILSLVLIISFSATSQDSTYLTAQYGEQQLDEVDSSLVYHSIDVTVHNVDTLDFLKIQIELLDTSDGRLVVRKIISKNEDLPYFNVNEDSIDITIAVLPKSNYKIIIRLIEYNGLESPIYETNLSLL